MSLTPNFGMNIPDATDIVNLLTQCYPNFTLLDGALQSIKETGVTTASETKSGTVHQLVRTDGDCDVLRFTATSNFATGDSFTVDGTPVTGVAVNGASLQTGDFVINSNVLAILNGAVLTLFAGGNVAPAASDVTYDNTVSGLTATDVQNAIDENAAGVAANTAAIGAIVPGSKMTVLYTNPNPTVGMGEGTTITLSSSDYDALIGIFRVDVNDATEVGRYSSMTLKGYGFECSYARTSGSNYVTITNRRIDYTSDTVLTVHDATEQTSGGSNAFTTINRFVPVKIIGVKF